MGTLSSLREGIAANLAPLDGNGIQISPYILAEPSPPTIQILPGAILYDLTMHRGADEYTLTVQALAPLTVDVEAQRTLDALIDEPDSIKTLIEADPTLGGIADAARVVDCSGYQVVALEGRGPTLFCDWTVVVTAKTI